MYDARLAKIVDAATAENLSPRPEPDGLREVDALILGQQLGGQTTESSQHCLRRGSRICESLFCILLLLLAIEHLFRSIFVAYILLKKSRTDDAQKRLISVFL